MTSISNQKFYQHAFIVQGNCSEPIPEELTKNLTGPPLLPLKPGQCLVLLFGNAMQIVSETAHNFWIDSLYLRQLPMKDPPDHETTLVSVDKFTSGAPADTAPSVWMSNVTIQGNGEGSVKAVRVSSRLAAEGAP
jgi:hypothetical protein